MNPNQDKKEQKSIEEIKPKENLSVSKIEVPFDKESNTYGVRESLKNAGIDDIRWEDGVMVSNKATLTPTKIIDGVGYAGKNDIRNFINKSYESKNQPLVRANSYHNEYGLEGLLNYTDEGSRVTVDGVEIDYAYIDDDGNAWVRKDIMDDAYKNAADKRGIKKSSEYTNTLKENLKSTKQGREKIADEIENYNYTTEDLKNDPVYKAYAEVYREEGRRAYNDALGNMAARNMGALTSGAQLAAAESQNYYLENLAKNVPQIADMAYSRFMDKKEYDYENLLKDEENAHKLFSTAYSANRDRIDDSNATAEDNKNRFLFNETLESKRLENASNMVKNAIEEAQLLGYYSDKTAKILGIPKNPDGSYPDVNASEIAREKAIWEEVLKPQYTYQHLLDIDAENNAHKNNLEAAGIEFDNDIDKMLTSAMLEKQLNKEKTETEYGQLILDIVGEYAPWEIAAPNYTEALQKAVEYLLEDYEEDDETGIYSEEAE